MKIKNLLLKKLFSYFVNRQCPMTITTVGPGSQSYNCYYVHIYFESDTMIVLGVDNNEITGKLLKEDKFSEEASISFENIELSSIHISHYYKGAKLRYSKLRYFFLLDLTKLYVLYVYYKKIKYFISNFIFMHKKLVMVQRYELLKVLVKYHVENYNKRFSILDITDELNAINWIVHPKGNEFQEKLEFYLDSLVESKDIKKDNVSYYVNAKAITTIENYEIEERRHKDNVKFQRRMVALTFFLVAFGLIQAGLIKLPTLIDLSKFNLSDLKSILNIF